MTEQLIQEEVLTKDAIRNNIIAFEGNIKSIEGAFIGDSDNCPLTHRFSDGVYMREIFIPKGMFIVGKIHLHSHPLFLMQGEVDIITDEGAEHLVAPYATISPSGVKRALFTISDCVFITVHHNPTNTQDLEELENIIIAKNYNELEEHNNINLIV